MRFDDNKEYVKHGKKPNPVTGAEGVPSAKHSSVKASKRWAGMSAPKPKKIEKDGKWVTYGDYLRGAHWHRKRKEALNYWGYTCMSCGIKDTPLQVHHSHYDDLWKEEVTELRVYCGRCHKEQDEKRRNS